MAIHLRSITQTTPIPPARNFPFTLPAVASLAEMAFHRPVTLFVGENGTGKSTLLEAIACGVGSITVGDEAIERDSVMEPARRLSEHLRMKWARRTRKGFFLRAEDFLGHGRRIRGIAGEFAVMEREYDEGYQEHPSAEGLRVARDSARGQKAALINQYETEFSAVSHGESFLRLFKERIVPGGLYLLDEPESPLSPVRQLAFLSLLKAKVAEECQFIIATHSPIVMACPEATLVSFDHAPVREVAYDEVDHVVLMREFLNNPIAFLRHL